MMNGSVGQALREARLAKKITLEEAARATKIRAERIADLEADDYMRFPNVVYARSFLILYAKYLGVDISRYPTVEVGFDTGLGEYTYLQQNEEAPTVPVRRRRRAAAAPPEKPRWFLAFLVFLAMLALSALITWGVMTLKRLGPVEPRETAAPTAPTAAPTPATPRPSPTSTVTPPPPGAPAAMPGGAEVRPTPAEQVIRAVPASPAASPISETSPEAEAAPTVVAAVPVQTPPEASPTPEAEATPAVEGEQQEIAIRSSRKIRLRVVRDDPKAPSVYHGSLNPLMKPLVFVGRHFWIKTAEPDAVQVTIGGQPAPASAVEIVPTPGI